MREAGRSFGWIAKKTGAPKTTIQTIWAAHGHQNDFQTRPRPGRPRNESLNTSRTIRYRSLIGHRIRRISIQLSTVGSR